MGRSLAEQLNSGGHCRFPQKKNAGDALPRRPHRFIPGAAASFPQPPLPFSSSSMRRATEMYSKACLWKARTRSTSPPGTGAGGEAEAGAGAARELLLAAMRAREKRWQSHTKRSPKWKATKRSSAKPKNSGLVSGDCDLQGPSWSQSRCWRDRRRLQKIPILSTVSRTMSRG
uniref:Dpy-30 histone methyltransferase complex regulatory subunit n=1 Tax=Sus scrofa TaxID=9823 RepID=A0A4X1TDE2_PIG